MSTTAKTAAVAWLISGVRAGRRGLFRNPQSLLRGMIAGLMFIQATVFDMVWGVRCLQDARGIEYAEAVIRQFSGTATGVVNVLNLTFSALLGPVFSASLTRASGGAQVMDHGGHYQSAFHPLYGVGLAFALTFLLKETGPAARRALA